MKIRNNAVIKSRNQAVEMINRYSVLATDDGMHESENIMSVCENLTRITNSMQKTNTKHDKQEDLITARPQKELQKGAEIRPNPQNESITLRQYNTNGTNETYTIPTIINGRIPRNVSNVTSNQRKPLPQERKSNTDKRYATQTNTKHNLLLLGDSHARGLAERVSCSLDNSFSVT